MKHLILYREGLGKHHQTQHLVFTRFSVLVFIVSMLFLTSSQKINAQPVNIPDPGLRDALELALGKKVGEDITQAEMTGLQSLNNGCHFLTLSEKGVWWVKNRWICQSSNDMAVSGIQDLTGLEFATNLTELRLSGNSIVDVSPLKDLTKLIYLDLGQNKISDVSPLKDLTNLTHLSLGQNNISDVSPLKDLTNLTHLSLIYNSVSDISVLNNLTQLIELDLLENKILNISPLKDMTNLTHLSLRSNKISDLSPLKDLTRLTYISLRDNKISDVSPLKDLTKLTYMHIGFNYTISDVSPLKELTNLKHLQLDHNQISDVSPLKDLIKLIHLDASDNKISDLSALKNLTKLTWIDLDTNENLDLSHLKYFPNLTFLDIHDNEISDLSPLKDLPKLKKLDLDDNKISDVSPLEVLTNLTELDLSGNHISDVSPLSGLINLRVLDLSGNHIPDFSPIAGLIGNLVKYDNSKQTIPTYKPEDVNRDGVVNILDLVLVAFNFDNPDLVALAQMNIYPDVNSDGVVDIRDLVITAAEIGSAAAPTLSKNSIESANLTTENLTQWIRLAMQLDIFDSQTQTGITILEQLLATLTLAETLPKETALLVNYPNPFNPETWIPYQLAKPAAVTITIHGVDGKLIRSLELGYLSAGVYRSKSRAAYWDGRNGLGEIVANGIYFYTLTSDNFTESRKMIIRK